MRKTYHLIICLLFFVCIADPGNAHNAVNKQQCVAETYTSQVGVKQTGHNTGPEIDQYLASVNLGPGYAWCAAFVKWTFDCCNIETTGNAWSPSWFPQSRTVYDRRHSNNTDVAAQGDVFGLYYSNLNRVGHVGFIHLRQGNYYVTVEGNTNDTGSRTGDGVYERRRHIYQIYQISRWI